MNEVSKTNDRRPWLERLALFAISFVFWLLLVWPVSPVDGRMLVGDIVAGLVVAAFVAMVMGEMIRSKLGRLLNPVSYFWAIIFIFVFSYYVIKGGMDVAWRVLHPAMPINPGIVRIRSVLKTDTGRTVLANSITLTPGTLTMDVTDDGIFYIHWLNVRTVDEEAAAELILRRFEWFIQRVFE